MCYHTADKLVPPQSGSPAIFVGFNDLLQLMCHDEPTHVATLQGSDTQCQDESNRPSKKYVQKCRLRQVFLLFKVEEHRIL
jgi:hypothetical protein